MMHQISMHRQVLANMAALLEALDCQKNKLTMENVTLNKLTSIHTLNVRHPKTGSQSDTPDREVLQDIVSNNQSAFLNSTMSNPDIENQAMNLVSAAERLLTKGLQHDPVAPSPNSEGLLMNGPSPEDVPLPSGNLSARQSVRKEQNEATTSMQAQGGSAPPGIPAGGLSASIGLCHDQRATQVMPMHSTSQVTESQAQKLNLASRPSVAQKPSQSQSTPRLPQTLQLNSLADQQPSDSTMFGNRQSHSGPSAKPATTRAANVVTPSLMQNMVQNSSYCMVPNYQCKTSTSEQLTNCGKLVPAPEFCS